MQLFYSSEISNTSNTFIFDKEESNHIIKVLRKIENDILYVTNGLGFLFETKIALASHSKCSVIISAVTQIEKPKYSLHLAVAPTKMNERFEWFLEKATEIGITEITPILCERSERKQIKNDRFEKIILAAMKQSNQLYLPILNQPISFKEFIKKEINAKKYIAHCEDGDKKLLKKAIQPSEKSLIMIGPEGDFTEKEIQNAITENFIPVSLGNTRLRTETAALVACHSVAFINE